MMKSSYIFAFKNYQAALIAAFFFGCLTPGAKLLIENLSPQSMAGLMYLAAGLGLFIVLLLRKKLKKSLLRVQKQDLKWFALATFFGGLLGPAFLTYGISRINASSASLLLNLESVFTSLIAWLIFKEHFEKKIVYGMILIVVACLLLSSSNFNALNLSHQGSSIEGYLLICLACFSWGLDNNFTRNISHLDPLLLASFKGLIAGSSNLLLGYLVGESLISSIPIQFILLTSVLGLFGIGFSLVAFIYSLRLIGTARTGAIFSTAPFIGLFLSITFLGESVSYEMMVAIFLMLAGVFLHFSEDHGHEHVHSSLSHSHEHIHDEHHNHQHHDDDDSEPHTHQHVHSEMKHKHPHFPDIHHQHKHKHKD